MKCKSLMDVLAEIPDFRKAKGKRHPLPAILGLACVAIMCGCRTSSAIADWERNYDRSFIEALGFTGPCSDMLRKSSYKTLDAGHGRIEERRLTASDELPHYMNYMNWPGLKQFFMVQRNTIIKSTGKCRAETVYGITSLSPQQADAKRLMELVRCHWLGRPTLLLLVVALLPNPHQL